MGQCARAHAHLVAAVRGLHRGRPAGQHDYIVPVQVDRAFGRIGQFDPLDQRIILPDLGIQPAAALTEGERHGDARRQQQHGGDDDKIAPFEPTAHRYSPFLRRGR